MTLRSITGSYAIVPVCHLGLSSAHDALPSTTGLLIVHSLGPAQHHQTVIAQHSTDTSWEVNETQFIYFKSGSTNNAYSVQGRAFSMQTVFPSTSVSCWGTYFLWELEEPRAAWSPTGKLGVNTFLRISLR